MLPAFSSEEFINKFLKDMLQDAGMTDLSPEVETQLLKDLRARLNERFLAELVSIFTEEEVVQFKELAESGNNQEDLEKFITDHIPNAAEIFSDALLKFRADYLGVSS